MNSLSIERRLGDLNRSLNGIYEDYCNLMIEQRYNGIYLSKTNRYNRLFEIIIAVGASSSGVAGLALWQNQLGQYIWGAISLTAIFISILKPILNFSADIQRYSQLSVEFSTLAARCRNLVQSIKDAGSSIIETGSLPEAIRAEIQQLRGKMVELAGKGDPERDTRLLKSLQEDVNSQIPPSTLWLPFAEERDDVPGEGTLSPTSSPQEGIRGLRPNEAEGTLTPPSHGTPSETAGPSAH